MEFLALVGMTAILIILSVIVCTIYERLKTIYEGVAYWRKRAHYAEDRLCGYNKDDK